MTETPFSFSDSSEKNCSSEVEGVKVLKGRLEILEMTSEVQAQPNQGLTVAIRHCGQCSEPSGGPTGTAGIMPRRRDWTGPLTVVLCRSSYAGDGRARLGPPGPTR